MPGSSVFQLRRSSSEPSSSTDSLNRFADDEACSDDSDLIEATYSNRLELFLSTKVILISLILFLSAIFLCILYVVIDQNQNSLINFIA